MVFRMNTELPKRNKDIDIASRLLLLPLPKLVEALMAFQDLDHYLIARVEEEGTPEQIAEAHGKVRARAVKRNQLLSYRLSIQSDGTYLR